MHGEELNNLSALISVLSLLNSSETVDQIYPELRQILERNFACAELIFALSDSADDATIYLWDNTTQQLDAQLTLPWESFHADFSARQPTFVAQVDPASTFLIDNLLHASQLQSYAAFPLCDGEQSIGILTIAWREPNAYTSLQVDELTEIAQAITRTLLRSRRVNDLQNTLRNTRALYSASNALISTDSLKTILENVVNYSAVAIGSSYCILFVFAKNEPKIKHIAEYHNPSLAPLYIPSYNQLTQGLSGWVIENRNPTRLQKHQRDELASPIMLKMRAKFNIGALMVAPIIYREQVLGLLFALNTIEQPDFSEDDLALLSSLGNQAAAAIAKARLYGSRKRQVKILAAVRDFSLKLQSVRTFEALLAVISQEIVKLLNPAFIAINLLDDDDAVVVSATPEGIFPIGYRLPLHLGITGAVARSRKIEIIPDTQADARTFFPTNAPLYLKSLKTTVSLPLLDSSVLIGVMNISFQTVRDFDSADHTLFQAITSLIGSSLQHVLLLDSLEERVDQRNQQLVFANQELQDANKRLQELDGLKNKFISDVSHELRTPLTSLSLYLDLLERRPDRQKHYLDVVRGEVSRLRTLVLDVLKIARLDSQQIATNLKPICMTDIVMHEVAMHRERAEAVGLEVEIRVDPDSRPILGDVAQLAEMVTALLYNAINYCEQGKVEITLSYIPLSSAMELSIADHGIGIPADEIDHVFQRFYRGSNASSRAGSGLGLNLVEEIVHLHNGYINLTSELGKGTTVRVLLPAIQKSDETTDAKQAATMTTSK